MMAESFFILFSKGRFVLVWAAFLRPQPFKLLSRPADCNICATTFHVESAPEPSLRILLAEDNRTPAAWLEKAWRHDGFSADCMDDGVQCDHVLLTQEYDLAIPDHTLPRR